MPTFNPLSNPPLAGRCKPYILAQMNSSKRNSHKNQQQGAADVCMEQQTRVAFLRAELYVFNKTELSCKLYVRYLVLCSATFNNNHSLSRNFVYLHCNVVQLHCLMSGNQEYHPKLAHFGIFLDWQWKGWSNKITDWPNKWRVWRDKTSAISWLERMLINLPTLLLNLLNFCIL